MELVTNSYRAEQIIAGNDGEIQKVGNTIFVQVAVGEGPGAAVILAHLQKHVTDRKVVPSGVLREIN